MNCSKILVKKINCGDVGDPLILSPKVILAMTAKERQQLWIKNVNYCKICGKYDRNYKKNCSQYVE